MPEWLLQVLTACGGAATVYAGIRADLAALKVKAEQAVKSADEAHRRIDSLHSLRGSR
jgi:hypothetical protein